MKCPATTKPASRNFSLSLVLKSRLGPRYKHPSMMLDVQRAMRYVRVNASRFGIKPDRIGVWGSSAGGHLASTAATHFDAGNPQASDPVERVSSRPDFAILAYGVVSLVIGFFLMQRMSRIEV
jgi:acetyl esterase/lipase